MATRKLGQEKVARPQRDNPQSRLKEKDRDRDRLALEYQGTTDLPWVEEIEEEKVLYPQEERGEVPGPRQEEEAVTTVPNPLLLERDTVPDHLQEGDLSLIHI